MQVFVVERHSIIMAIDTLQNKTAFMEVQTVFLRNDTRNISAGMKF